MTINNKSEGITMSKWTNWWKSQPYNAIEIPAEVLRQIQAYTKACDIEISGFGKTHIREEGGNKIMCIENI